MPTRLRKKDLKHYKPQIHALHTNINDILLMIDEKIKIQHSQGSNSIIFQLSGTFDIPKMTPYAARNKIHSAIISDLTCEEREFQVQYKKTRKNRYILLIKWKTDEELYEKRDEIDLLQFYSKSIDEQLEYSEKPRSIKYQGIRNFKH
jgi:tryptophan synthase alpha subunit